MGTSSQLKGLVSVQDRLSIKSAPIRLALHQFECDLRVAIPGIVVANQNGDPFNADLQTVSVQPSVQEVLRVKAIPTLTTLPILDDVPFVFPSAGGWNLTFPIAIGDECLVIFADMAFDMWWQNGGIQKQPDGPLYRHDIGDGVAIFGVRSNPRVLQNYSTTSMQICSDDGTVVIDMAEAGITMTAPEVKILVTGGTVAPLMNKNFFDYWNTNILPFLQSKGYAGPDPPTDSISTILEAE
jgi:protein gp138